MLDLIIRTFSPQAASFKKKKKIKTKSTLVLLLQALYNSIKNEKLEWAM